MEPTPQTPRDRSMYMSAPDSPSVWSLQFFSAPASPSDSEGNASFDGEFSPRKVGRSGDFNSDFDDFEFETSKNFDLAGFEFETSQRFECLTGDQERQMQRGGSLPTMAFADELFCNGLVMPLKLPPRLQYAKHVGLSSTASSPRSPGSGLRRPFSWRGVSEDEFDPFMVALEKVKSEKRVKKHGKHHRRTRSLSPFRITTPRRSDASEEWNQDQYKKGSLLEPKEGQLGPTPDGLGESKGSAYARWVRDQNRQMSMKKAPKVEKSPKGPSKKKWLKKGVKSLKKGLKSFKMEEDGPIKPNSTTIPGPKVQKGDKNEESGEGFCDVETRAHKVGRILMKYASFRKDCNEEKAKEQEQALVKPTYFRGQSLSYKGNANQSGKKKKFNGEHNMAITKSRSRPKLTLCLGSGIESPNTRTG